MEGTVNKVAYDRHDPYHLLCLIMILRSDQHKYEFILYMCIMSYYQTVVVNNVIWAKWENVKFSFSKPKRG